MSAAHTANHDRSGRSIAGLATGRTHAVAVQRRVVPVIFVPGIMGSRLATTVAGSADGKKRWDPDDKGFMFDRYVSIMQPYPAKKRRLLIGPGEHANTFLEPLVDDAKHNQQYALSPVQVARRWGGVAWSSYGTFLRWLSAELTSRYPVTGRINGREMRLVEMPVFAFPYNWTASCARSGQQLADYLPVAIEQARRELESPGLECPGVILVTHSMGGLVARAACKRAGGRVLGVVHGVQPAVGAAAAYWRMKAGFPRSGNFDFPAMALGKNGDEVVALLGNMPGGLELLPSRDYRAPDGGAAWLHWPMPDGHRAAMPRADAYQEIYKSRTDPWALIRDYRQLDPAGTRAAGGLPNAPSLAQQHYGRQFAAEPPTWLHYQQRVDDAGTFHQGLSGYHHPHSTHFWGVGGGATPATISFDAAEERPAVLDDPDYALVAGPQPGGSRADDDGDTATGTVWQSGQACAVLNLREANWGEYVFWQPIARNGQIAYTLPPTGRVWHCVLHRPSESGDGTVPERSGAALAGRPSATARAFPHIDHEAAYRVSDVQQFVATAVARLVPAPTR